MSDTGAIALFRQKMVRLQGQGEETQASFMNLQRQLKAFWISHKSYFYQLAVLEFSLLDLGYELRVIPGDQYLPFQVKKINFLVSKFLKISLNDQESGAFSCLIWTRIRVLST